jgi:hypothetical protein
MSEPRLTRRQLQCLAKLEGELEGDLPGRILTEIRPETLCRWLAQQRFRLRLRQLFLALRVRGDLGLAHAAARAAERLAAGQEGASIDHEERRACIDLVGLAQGVRRRMPAQKRTARSSRNRPPAKISGQGQREEPEHDVIHPDVPPEEVRQLLERLSRP